MDTRRGANRAECIYTQEDFNDLSSGIRRMTIDTRFHLDRSRTLLRTRLHPRGVLRGHELLAYSYFRAFL